MAVNMFLKVDAIKGESTDPAHLGWIDVLAMSWGEANPTPAFGVGGAGKVNMQDLSVTKYLDKASVPLLMACAAGTHLTNVTLVALHTGAAPYQFMKLSLDTVIVSSVSEGGSGGEDQFAENISFAFAKITWTYTTADGRSSTGSWNLETNTPA
jgi:type VI secretion system secreted protein Hcp